MHVDLGVQICNSRQLCVVPQASPALQLSTGEAATHTVRDAKPAGRQCCARALLERRGAQPAQCAAAGQDTHSCPLVHTAHTHCTSTSMNRARAAQPHRQPLSRAVSRCPHRSAARPPDDGIGDDGAVALAAALKDNSTLKTLDLYGAMAGPVPPPSPRRRASITPRRALSHNRQQNRG
eukprot:4623278-Prymnesium_polylepis.1